MIRSHSHNQLTLAAFDWPFQVALDEENRWVKLGNLIPWDALSESYYQSLNATQGRPAKEARLVIGAVIIKHKLCLSDEETVRTDTGKPVFAVFCGVARVSDASPFCTVIVGRDSKTNGTDRV